MARNDDRGALFSDDAYESDNIEDRRDEGGVNTDDIEPGRFGAIETEFGRMQPGSGKIPRGYGIQGASGSDKLVRFAGGGSVDDYEDEDNTGAGTQYDLTPPSFSVPKSEELLAYGAKAVAPYAQEFGERALGGLKKGAAKVGEMYGAADTAASYTPGPMVGRGVKKLLEHLIGPKAQPVTLAPAEGGGVTMTVGEDSHTLPGPEFLAWMADAAEHGGQASGQTDERFEQAPQGGGQAFQPRPQAGRQAPAADPSRNRQGSVGERQPLWEPDSREGRSRALFPMVSEERQRQAWLQGQEEQETRHDRSMELAGVGVEKARQQGSEGRRATAEGRVKEAGIKGDTARDVATIKGNFYKDVHQGMDAQRDAAARMRLASDLQKTAASIQNQQMRNAGMVLAKKIANVPFGTALDPADQEQIKKFYAAGSQGAPGGGASEIPAQVPNGGQPAPQQQNVPAREQSQSSGAPAVGTTKVFMSKSGKPVEGVWDGSKWKPKQ
jgi:hypothetical protein